MFILLELYWTSQVCRLMLSIEFEMFTIIICFFLFLSMLLSPSAALRALEEMSLCSPLCNSDTGWQDSVFLTGEDSISLLSRSATSEQPVQTLPHEP